MWGIRAVALALTFAAAGCTSSHPYQCTASAQCVLDGEPGYCEPEGYCSFIDTACAGGRRFEPNAGDGLGSTCTDQAPLIDAPDIDAPLACGAVGQACCSSETACVDGATCQSGTCAGCVADVALGHRFSCFLKAGGTVWCSGVNLSQQLGRTDPMPSAMPLQISDATGPIADATAVFAGYETACALRANAAVWCWGEGSTGELGDGVTTPADDMTAKLVVKADLTPLTGIATVDGGFAHMCARSTAGEVWCWGRADSGQLGDGLTTPPTRNVAAQVLDTVGGTPFSGATALGLGGDQTCALKGTELWCWGANGDHQLGDDTTTARSVPGMVGAATSIGPGNYHTCFVKPDTSIACMGGNWHGTIGNGLGGDYTGPDANTPTPVQMALGGAPLMGATEVGAGGAVSCALMQSSKVMCWGDNKHGQIGAGSGNNVPTPVLRKTSTGFAELDGVDRLLVGFVRACAHRTNGEWWCWGRGRDGEFGDNTFLSRGFASPLRVGLTCP